LNNDSSNDSAALGVCEPMVGLTAAPEMAAAVPSESSPDM
jgi:hypothetical protein